MTAKAAPTFTDSMSNLNAGKCLGVLAANMTNGTSAVQWACDGTANQKWAISTPNGFPANNFVTQLRNSQNPNKCLGVLASATGDGANLVIWDCNGSLDQFWDFQQVIAPGGNFPFGCYTIANANAFPRVLGILAGSTSDGAQAVIWDNLNHGDQTWCPR
jgi:hypothetical protein